MAIEKPHDPEIQIVHNAAAQLMEHFDAVQIFVTRYDSKDGTVQINHGRGNYYARRGQVDWWRTIEDEDCRERTRKTDDGEE